MEPLHGFRESRSSVSMSRESKRLKKLECGPMPNVMVALSNIGGASVQCRKVWLTLTTWLPCSNAAKSRKPLKLAGVFQTGKPISAASGPNFTILWRHVEDINKFFPVVDTCLSCEDIARQSCAMVPRWRFLATFLRPVFQRAACSTFQTCILNSH